MSIPVIDLATPTRLVFEWGWLLVTRANFVVYVLAVAVFIAGATVRLPGARKDLEAVERARMAASARMTAASGRAPGHDGP